MVVLLYLYNDCNIGNYTLLNRTGQKVNRCPTLSNTACYAILTLMIRNILKGGGN